MILEYNNRKPKIGKNVFIAPTATIIGDVEIMDGANIWYGTVLRGDTSRIRVGRNTNIQDNCTVHTEGNHPALIGDNVTIGHNAVVHGCTVEDESMIGIGAVILNGAYIRTGSIVAAGSVVTEGQEIGPHVLAAGTPAKIKKELSASSNERITRPVKNYLRLASEHAATNGCRQ